ncbi:tetratricopeptide repeat protein [Catellatospora aurea]|uniref:Tetratricopeptide repeat protein n=1 Tax=Catellatospora aurea TaxID=1337874 RepID=A0ABW2H303_9ACTN
MGILEEYERGRLFFDYGDYITAAQILGPVVDEAPDDVAPRLLLARAYYHSAQLHKAEDQLRRVLDHDPAEHYAHLMLGRCLQRQSRHDEARPHLRIADAMGIGGTTA